MAACQWKHRGGCCLRYIQPFKQTECWEIGKTFFGHEKNCISNSTMVR